MYLCVAVHDHLNVVHARKLGNVAVCNIACVLVVERGNAHGGVAYVDGGKIRIFRAAEFYLGADGTRAEITTGETEGLAIKICI